MIVKFAYHIYPKYSCALTPYYTGAQLFKTNNVFS